MPIFNLSSVLGFGFGATLAIIILSLTRSKIQKDYDDYTFFIMILMCSLWLGGKFIYLLIDFLFGSVAILEMNIALLIANIGLVSIPSSLVHALLAIFHSARKKPREILLKYNTLIVTVLYSPLFIFIIAAGHHYFTYKSLNTSFTDTIRFSFFFWLLFALTISVLICENLARTHDVEADRHFYRDLSISLAGIGIGIMTIYIIPTYKIVYVGPYLDLLMLLSPCYPMAVLAYYVYRYNFYRLVIKPSLVYSIIYGTVMAVYLLGIKRLGEYLEQFPEVNSTFIEGILLIALVFAFQPVRERLHNRLNKIFFKDRYYFQQILRELSDTIIGIVDLEKLLDTICESLSSAFNVKSPTIVVFQTESKKSVILKTVGHQDFTDFFALVNAFTQTKRSRLRQQIKDPRVAIALAHNHLKLAVPVFYQKTMLGIICLADKQTGIAYSEDEIDILQTFANQIALAIENARLVHERLNLEARVYQAEKLNSLGQLATTMSHEIKNPLSSIKSIVQVLRENSPANEAQDLDVIVREINRLDSILIKLLNFAKPASNEPENVNITDIIQDVITLLKYQANKFQISIQFTQPEFATTILAKTQSIREIIFNLVLNAIQSIAADGSVQIFLKEQSSVSKIKKASRRVDLSKVKKWVILVVKDNGPGISKENQKLIFEQFFTTKTIGTGLGLSIVKKNVEDTGGFIIFKSEKNSGTEFEVYFPVY